MLMKNPNRWKDVHDEFIRTLTVFDTGIRPNLQCTAPGIRGGNLLFPAKE